MQILHKTKQKMGPRRIGPYAVAHPALLLGRPCKQLNNMYKTICAITFVANEHKVYSHFLCRQYTHNMFKYLYVVVVSYYKVCKQVVSLQWLNKTFTTTYMIVFKSVSSFLNSYAICTKSHVWSPFVYVTKSFQACQSLMVTQYLHNYRYVHCF